MTVTGPRRQFDRLPSGPEEPQRPRLRGGGRGMAGGSHEEAREALCGQGRAARGGHDERAVAQAHRHRAVGRVRDGQAVIRERAVGGDAERLVEVVVRHRVRGRVVPLAREHRGHAGREVAHPHDDLASVLREPAAARTAVAARVDPVRGDEEEPEHDDGGDTRDGDRGPCAGAAGPRPHDPSRRSGSGEGGDSRSYFAGGGLPGGGFAGGGFAGGAPPAGGAPAAALSFSGSSSHAGSFGLLCSRSHLSKPAIVEMSVPFSSFASFVITCTALTTEVLTLSQISFVTRSAGVLLVSASCSLPDQPILPLTWSWTHFWRSALTI